MSQIKLRPEFTQYIQSRGVTKSPQEIAAKSVVVPTRAHDSIERGLQDAAELSCAINEHTAVMLDTPISAPREEHFRNNATDIVLAGRWKALQVEAPFAGDTLEGICAAAGAPILGGRTYEAGPAAGIFSIKFAGDVRGRATAPLFIDTTPGEDGIVIYAHDGSLRPTHD